MVLLEDVACCICLSFLLMPDALLVGIIKGDKNKEEKKKKKVKIKGIVELDHSVIEDTLHASLTAQIISPKKKGRGKVFHLF